MATVRVAAVILGLAACAAFVDAQAQTPPPAQRPAVEDAPGRPVGPPISLRGPQPAIPAPPPAPAAAPAPIAVAPLPPPTMAAPSAAPPAVAVPQPPAPPVATAEEVVRAFYAAVSAADGAQANAYLVAEKRNQGSYDSRAMSAFYGAMAEPLRLLDAKEIMQGLVRVRYHYAHRSGRRCDGTADVIVVPSEGRLLIERIRAFNGC